MSDLLAEVYPELRMTGPESFVREHHESKLKALGRRAQSVVAEENQFNFITQLALELEDEAEELTHQELESQRAED